MKKIIYVVLVVLLMIGLVACGTQKEKEEKIVQQNPIVTMTMDNGDVIKIELYPQIAPETVKNFISLINKGFYNGLTFHRVIPGFVVQGGDPEGNGTGGAGYNIYGEFSANGFKSNTLSHDVGVVSMARANNSYNSASSQFFIVTDSNAKVSLDNSYAAFGKVIEGMDAVNTIVNSEVIRRDYSDELVEELNKYANEDSGTISDELLEKYYKETMEINRPVNPPVIKSMTVETFGQQYDEPTHY